MANVGDLVQLTDGRWMTLSPDWCPNGHRLGGGRTLVGTHACSCLTRHTSWFCRECGAMIYAPELGKACSLVNGPASVR
ncbi:hypothetical protein [Mycolicibacterium peregrinum]|uniref:hypothetical protein n=1 Tax=Mycolicibacterium peregrinum TaxID=43304 RepID=UPI003AAD95FE